MSFLNPGAEDKNSIFDTFSKLLNLQEKIIIHASSDLQVLDQTCRAMEIISETNFYSIRDFFSTETCGAVLMCIDNKVDQTVYDKIDGQTISVKIIPHSDTAYLMVDFNLNEISLQEMNNISLYSEKTLRECLSLIISASDSVRCSVVSEDHTDEYMRLIRKNALKILRHSSHITMLYKYVLPEHIYVRRADLVKMTHQIANGLCALYPKQIICDVQFDPSPFCVHCDTLLLSTAICNILTNCVMHSEDINNIRIIVKGSIYKDRVIISISDNGPGIDPNKVSDIFHSYVAQPYNESNLYEKYKIGIGLALVRKIMGLHYGVAFVDTSNNGGTTVNLSFPLELPCAREDDLECDNYFESYESIDLLEIEFSGLYKKMQ